MSLRRLILEEENKDQKDQERKEKGENFLKTGYKKAKELLWDKRGKLGKGMTIAVPAALAAGLVGYKLYKKRKADQQEQLPEELSGGETGEYGG